MKEKILVFTENRVLRLYSGGAGIDRLCGKTHCEDTRFPENWIASCIEGNGRAYHSPRHGISKFLLDGRETDFPSFLREHADEMLGGKHAERFGPVPGVLVKFLDAAEQLPLQVHPTKEDAKKYLHSDYGKTEAWIVLATREIGGEKPYLLAGFNHALDRKVFTEEVLRGKLDKGFSMLNRLHVKPGDVIVIRGGLPHAIGPGVTMVEVMEPSDWVIIPEIECCGIRLNEKQRFMGINPETAVGMFDFTPMTPEEIQAKYSPEPLLIRENESGTLRSVIPPSCCKLFSAEELTVHGRWIQENPDSCGIGAVVEGSLNIEGCELRSGSSFFLPFSTKQLEISGNGRLLLIRPPSILN